MNRQSPANPSLRPVRLARHVATLSLGLAVLCPSATAVAQAPDSPILTKPAAETCAQCGVVRSIRRIESNPGAAAEESKPSPGYLASIPLDGGKPLLGSSTDVRREQSEANVTYEIVVRLDDGRFQLLRQDDGAGLREGDKVRIERGKAVLRSH